MKTALVFFLTFVATVNCLSIFESLLGEWSLFKIKHKKTYEEKEDSLRFKIFLDNKHKIAQHNLKFLKGDVKFYLEMNHFGDMLRQEFVEITSGYKPSNSEYDDYFEKLSLDFMEPANVKLPEEVDWRKLGAVTRVKDQKNCGSCWAFSATGALEGQHFRQNGSLIPLSEQNLIDCSGKFGNMGCHGGFMTNAFNYVKANHGLDTEDSYPYEAENDVCRYNPRNKGADDAGYVNVGPPGDESKLQAAVATVGPISVSIDASHMSFQFYKGGVYYEPECSPTDLRHAVLVVGYGTDANTKEPYWLVKNSWSTSWGDSGYIRMSRNRQNHCGIATVATYPIVTNSRNLV